MATTRNTGKIIEPWSGSGWPLSIFVDQKALTEKAIYFCSRTECGQKSGRILREPWQLTCGHRLCKECFDFIQSLPGDQKECDACKNEPFDDDARTPRTREVVSTDHMDVDRQARNGDAVSTDLMDVDKHTRFDAVQLIETEEQQLHQQQEQQLEPRFCKIDSMKAMKDNAANRELNRMLVNCPYECGTGSKLTVRTIDKHMNACEQRLVPCEKCAEVIRYSQKSEHAANTCPFRPADCPNNCNKSGLRGKDLPKHMLECEKKPPVCNICKHPYAFNEKPGDHMMRCVAKCPLGCSESAEVKIIEHLSAEHLVEEHLLNLLQMFSKADSVLKTQGPSSGAGVARTQITSMLERLLQLESKSDKTQRMLVDKVSKMTQESASGLLTKARVAEKNRSDLDDLEALFKVLAQDVHILTSYEKRFRNLVERTSRKEIETTDRQNKLETLANIRIAEIEDQKSALNDMQMTSFNGRLIWRIDRVQQRRDEFRSKPFILSHAFFTSVYGFKMCAKLYLNGDGTGVKTHISLYFVVMKGEYDALLHWSFQQKVTLKLKNQTRKVDVSESFRPDPTSPCFEKPKTDMNAASGCPQFAEQAYVFSPQNGFVVDNTMFIEISVDSSYEAQKGLNTSVQENGESHSPPGRNQPNSGVK